MKNLLFKIFAILLFVMSCDNLKRQSEFPCVCNEHIKFLYIEKYIYPIGAHDVYLIDSFNNKYFCFDYIETSNGLSLLCRKDTIIFIKTKESYINDSVTRHTDIDKVIFLKSKNKFIRSEPDLIFQDDTTKSRW